MSVDFRPNLGEYKSMKPFFIWCQKVLPLVYDDSLSYYEVLEKVVAYLNVVIENNTTTQENIQLLSDAYDELQGYVNHYFDNLDVQEEINNKLDTMAEDGTLSDLIEPFMSNFTEAVDDLTNEVERLISLVGTPLVASQVSEMTDTDKIYVYVGNETGYNNGHWYYWNGTSWADGGVYNAIAFETDTTLSVPGMAADAKITGDEIADLEFVTDNKVISNFVTGKYIATNGDTADINSPVTSATYAYVVVDCVEGDVFTITGLGGATPRLFAFLGAESEGVRPVLMKHYSSIRCDNVYIYAPANAQKLVVNVNITSNGGDHWLVRGKLLTNLWKDVAKNDAVIGAIEKAVTLPNLSDPSGFSIGYILADGTVYTTSRTYEYTDYIPVSAGDVLYFTHNARYVTAYDKSKECLAESGSSSAVSTYTVPAGVCFVRVTFAISDATTFMVSKKALNFIPYGTPLIDRTYLPEDPIIVNDRKLSYVRESGDLSTGEYLFINKKMPVKNGSVLQFSGNVSGEFAGIEIGYSNDPTDSDNTHFKIDATKFYRVTSNPNESNHNLTISGNISVTLTQTFTHLMVDVVANGEKYHSSNGWVPLNKGMYVKVLSAMTDCVLSWTAEKARKDIVIFGDSYVSYSQSRWVYYLDNDNDYIDNVQIIGYSGEGSANGYENFTEYMPYSNAKYLIWAYGMNDHDTESAPNATWKEKIDAVIAYCVAHAITPVLCTIPNVPDYSNAYKNAYVRSFIGTYPVIDFAKAVGSDISSSWYAGYLSNDDVHPTELGAIALYNKAIADFPQLCVK